MLASILEAHLCASGQLNTLNSYMITLVSSGARMSPVMHLRLLEHAVQDPVIDFGAVALVLQEAPHGLLRRVSRAHLVFRPHLGLGAQRPAAPAGRLFLWLRLQRLLLWLCPFSCSCISLLLAGSFLSARRGPRMSQICFGMVQASQTFTCLSRKITDETRPSRRMS